MPAAHWLLALSAVSVWGTNFVVVRWGLDELPPFLFAALRFGLSAFPLIFFVRRPAVAWRKLAAFGVLIGVGQFGLMFWAMRNDISPGLASLVVQSQVFFTIVLTVVIAGERMRPLQIAALALAVAGMATIAVHLDAQVTAFGVALTLLAAVNFALGNLVARSAGRVDTLGFMVWSSVFATLPLALLSAAVDGPAAMSAALGRASAGAWATVVWQAAANTLFGYSAWNWLLARYPAATVAPSALLVPVIGMATSAWLLGESLPAWKLQAAGLVIAGLALNTLAGRSRAAAIAAPR